LSYLRSLGYVNIIPPVREPLRKTLTYDHVKDMTGHAGLDEATG
jgi:hypothetical protein